VLWHCWLGGRKGIQPIKRWGDGGGGHWLVWMECHPAGWSVCLPLLIFPCTIKSISSLLAPAHLGGPGKGAVKRLWWWLLCDNFARILLQKLGILHFSFLWQILQVIFAVNGSCHVVSYGALTQLLGHKNLCQLSPTVLFQNKEEETNIEPANQVRLVNKYCGLMLCFGWLCTVCRWIWCEVYGNECKGKRERGGCIYHISTWH